MDKTYDPQLIEENWTKLWEHHHYSEPSNEGSPYCIALPPPNVTGTLHMGHGFQHTLMDALIRYHRMCGNNTLWQGGTDHAGIATQMVVERQLHKDNKTRHDLGREAFIRRVWQWREESGHNITQQMRRMGVSLDWSRERFSMDERMSHATREAFIRLYNEGLIYRGKKLVNWDPKLNTAISDLEVETHEEQGKLWYIKYPCVTHDGHITVATTRPETLFGDVAVAVHPEDERYQNLISQQVRLPLTERTIPIVADTSVDSSFGTGCVKITPAHDFNDYELGLRHQLPLINIMTPTAHLNDEVPTAFQGLDRFVARTKVIETCQEQGLIEKIVDHKLAIPRGEKSGAVIEPFLTNQWFMSMSQLAQPALDALKNNSLQFVPANWQTTYRLWLENIEDWCISRQLWWGHRIPVWYDAQNTIYVGHHEQDVRQRYQLANNIQLHQESDVLDTWFSASLWPFATLGWPEQTPDFTTFYPTQVLVTGFDIIFFWVARMVMMGLKLTGKVPFKEVYITGLIRDSFGKKMSKSKGNVIDPIDLIDGIDLEALVDKRTRHLMQPKMAEQVAAKTRQNFPDGIAAHGTDALRFTFCALATTGRDINFDMGRIEGYRNFCNKLWNAARYVTLNTQPLSSTQIDTLDFSLADHWLLSRCQTIIDKCHQHFKRYRFDLIAQALYEFTWNDYCDWFVEFAKCTLKDDQSTPNQLDATRYTLLHVLEILLRLLHPLMPFITEEIWHRVAPLCGIKGESIMLAPYPQLNKQLIHHNAESTILWCQKIITAIRTMRSETNVAPNKHVELYINQASSEDRDLFSQCQRYIKTLAKVSTIHWQQSQDPVCATTLVNQLEIQLPLSGLIDKDVEIKRLDKEMKRLKKDIDRSTGKLNNPHYTSKAPAAIVDKERARLEQAQHTLSQLEKQYSNIRQL